MVRQMLLEASGVGKMVLEDCDWRWEAMKIIWGVSDESMDSRSLRKRKRKHWLKKS